MSSNEPDYKRAAGIVRDAGGQIVGRTRLQKIAFLLELAGCGEGFRFEYRHYGPYSEDLANAISVANAFDLVNEEEHTASWGGTYSIYTTTAATGQRAGGVRSDFAEVATKFGSIELELAATAAYLHEVEGYSEPWEETARRKPEKARDGRLERAKEVYRRLLALETPTPLPKIV